MPHKGCIFIDSRPVRFRDNFKFELLKLKQQFQGTYSYSEGMTRKIIRKIARIRARAILRALANKCNETVYPPVAEQEDVQKDNPTIQ